VITQLKDGHFTLPLDNGAQISVAIRVNAKERSAEVDFTGTSPQQPTTSTRPKRCAWPPCCMCSAPWWATTFRSTRVA
jgi:N-methylhydantoinase B/oxoprolinase/acetone carboxylase alpha subunit